MRKQKHDLVTFKKEVTGRPADESEEKTNAVSDPEVD